MGAERQVERPRAGRAALARGPAFRPPRQARRISSARRGWAALPSPTSKACTSRPGTSWWWSAAPRVPGWCTGTPPPGACCTSSPWSPGTCLRWTEPPLRRPSPRWASSCPTPDPPRCCTPCCTTINPEAAANDPARGYLTRIYRLDAQTGGYGEHFDVPPDAGPADRRPGGGAAAPFLRAAGRERPRGLLPAAPRGHQPFPAAGAGPLRPARWRGATWSWRTPNCTSRRCACPPEGIIYALLGGGVPGPHRLVAQRQAAERGGG